MVRLLTICLLSFTLFVPMVNAEEKPINIISCRSGTVSTLTADKELAVYAYELKGIDQDLKEDKIFEKYTHRCMGVTRVLGGEQLTKGYCKYMGPDGDYFIVSFDGLMGQQPLPW